MAKLLIVDDDEQNLYMLKALFEARGSEVITAVNGADALTLARREPPDLIIADILMPVMDGFTLCQDWRKDKELRAIPFVFYTATYTDPKDKELALRLGADRFIIKPEEPEVLEKVVEEVLESHKAGQLAPLRLPQKNDPTDFKLYNEALIRKLETKMVQLEATNHRFEREAAERMRAEKALKQSERELRTEHRIAGAFLTMTDDGVYGEVLKILLDALDSTLGMFGYMADDGVLVFPGATPHIWDMYLEPNKGIVLPRDVWASCVWAPAITKKKVLYSNEPLDPTNDGHAFLERFIASPALDRDEVIGLLLVANRGTDYAEADTLLLESVSNAVAPILTARLQRDRQKTERLILEEQLRQAQKMEAIGQLAGGVAHDFNNVLHAIMGYGTLALDAAQPGSEQYDCLLEVIKGAEHASNLTRQLLAFGRRQVLELKDIDLNDLVSGILKMIRRVIGAHIQLDFMPGPNLKTVHGDPGQLEQVLLNLCINARDAMPNGGKLTIETKNGVLDSTYCHAHPWAKPGNYVALKVSDTGMGMDEETQRQIFEPFFTTKQLGHGTGLGLATVYGIMKQHEGLIHVYSEVGRGSIFKAYLPAAARSASEEDRPYVGAVPGGTETILFAEDDQAIRTLVLHALEEAGYTVYCAENGEEAVAMFTAHPDEIALSVLDVVMPKLGGQGVYDKIKAIQPQARVLFISGYSAGVGGMRIVPHDQAPFLQKPFDTRALLQKVRDIIDSA